eukprot:scaffold132049_cov15-Tisochrysis_lutea.AAC.1
MHLPARTCAARLANSAIKERQGLLQQSCAHAEASKCSQALGGSQLAFRSEAYKGSTALPLDPKIPDSQGAPSDTIPGQRRMAACTTLCQYAQGCV